MSTSLADQLKRLAIPQTNLLSDAKKRASLLFDPSEAAKLSRDDLFEIGLSGIKELIEINPYFEEFHDSLFNFETRNVQRAVETKEVNKKLDNVISRFLTRLSPYLLLKPSHKALEWLIYRYRIHEMNVSDLLALILPYHESNIFVKALQLIDLSASIFKTWSWLETVQKKGLQLTKEILINHAISDSSFLRFICDSTLKALKVHAKTNTEAKLRTVMAFFASSAVGILARGKTGDHLLTVLLPTLLAGLTSPVIDFKAAAYMAVGQLAASSHLSSKLISQLLEIIAEDDLIALRNHRVLLLLTILQRQKQRALPTSLIKDFRWAVPILAELAKSGVVVGPLLKAIIFATLNVVGFDEENRVEAQILCWELIEHVRCDEFHTVKLLKALTNKYEQVACTLIVDLDEEDTNDCIQWLKLLIEKAFATNADILDRVTGDNRLRGLRGKWSKKSLEKKQLDPAILSLVKQCMDGAHVTAWPQLKPLLITQIDHFEILKAWCKASPQDETLTILLCINELVNTSNGEFVLTKIAESNYGRQSRTIQDLVAAVAKNKAVPLVKTVEGFFTETFAWDRKEITSWMTGILELRNLGKIFYRSKVWSIALRVLIKMLPSEANKSAIEDILQCLDLIKALPKNHQLDVISELNKHISASKPNDQTWFDLSKQDLSTALLIKTLEITLYALHDSSKTAKEFAECLAEFFMSCFPNASAGVRFFSSVCSGLRDAICPISTLLQVHALHWAWSQLKTNKSLFTVFKAEGVQLTCHILISLASSSQSVRKAAYKVLWCILDKAKGQKRDALPFQTLLTQLQGRSAEIEADADQLNVALYCLLSPNKSVTATLDSSLIPSLASDRKKLISVMTSETIPLYMAGKLMLILESVNSPDIIKALIPLANRAIASEDYTVRSIVLSSYWKRLNENTALVLRESNVWDLLKTCLSLDKPDAICPAITFLKSVDKDVFAALDSEQQGALLELMAATRADTENPAVASSVAIVCRKISLNAKIILRLLNKMVVPLPKRGKADARSIILEAQCWRHGVTLLELIQNKKKLRNSQCLIAPLFTILKFCLDQEEQMSFEYAKQLVLGVLLDICERLLATEGTIEENVLDVELIVQCLRVSSNPQTHHHALLLLSCIGSVIPNHVMHNIMTIFTFMGSSVARLDDEHSVQVVARVVDTIVPVLVSSFDKDGYGHEVVLAEVLRIFVWSMKDIPQHRRKPLFSRLLNTLDPERCLWIFLLLIFENYVGIIYKADKTAEGSTQANMSFGAELTLLSGPKAALKTVNKLISYLVEIPINRLNPISDKKAVVDNLPPANGLFDIKKHSSKELRHYTYTLGLFLTSLLIDNNLILQVQALESTDAELVKNIFQDVMGKVLLAAPSWHAQHEIHQNKFWKFMIDLADDLLNKLVALVSSDTLVGVITQLMCIKSLAHRRKALELLQVHLESHRGSFTSEEKASLDNLIQPLKKAACNRKKVTPEEEIIQQQALNSLTLLVRVLASEEREKIFKELLVDVCKLLKGKTHLMATAALTAAELVAVLSTAAFPCIPNFVPPILEVFTSYITAESPDIVVESITTALFRVLEVLPQFLSPYMDNLLFAVSSLSIKWPEAVDINKKLLQTRQKLASAVPHRVLIPSISRTYEKLVGSGAFAPVCPLMTVLAESFNAAQDVSKLLYDLTPFFIKVLQLRSDAIDGVLSVSDANVDKVEGYALDALLPLVLKLSELSFKPLYYQLFHWASEHPHRSITFYRLSSRLADGLKGLFVLFAGHFLQNAATLLDATNIGKSSKPYYGTGPAAEGKAIMLLENILKTLHTVFLYDSSSFLNKEKFQILLHPLVDQLDNNLGGTEALDERTKRLLTPCISQMALATDDTQWKSLNYQVLMKTTSTSPLVRIGALNTIVEISAKLGEDYLALLPETIGSFAELLEDEDERVELAMREALRRMEDVLGQNISDYFR